MRTPARWTRTGRARGRRPRRAAGWPVLVLVLLGAGCGRSPVPQNEILWDTWGIPHVYGTDETALYRGWGWAQARLHGDLMLELYGRARGRAAEYWGAEEDTDRANLWDGRWLESDRWVRTVGIPERAEAWYAALDAEERALLDGFVAGVNAYADAHPDRIADRVKPVLPVRPVDVLAHVQQSIHFTFVTNAGTVRAAARRLARQYAAGVDDAGRTSRVADHGAGRPAALAAGDPGNDRAALVPDDAGSGPTTPGGPFDGRRAAAPELVAEPGHMAEALASGRLRAGSNAWAIAPSRSATGNAMLLANPHLPWSDLFTWVEGHLVAPGLNASGAALVGHPFLGIAFNDRLGWTHTVNTHDGADLYEIRLADGGGYIYDRAVRRFEEQVDTIWVRESADSLRETLLVREETVHGPVVARVPGTGRALALRVVGLDRPHLIRQYRDMVRASSLAELETALRQLQMPMFTVMYADRDGRIMHLFGGLTPVRPGGDWDDWAGIVDGTTSETMWTDVHPYDDLPRVADPASGWLQNANDPPWTTTFPPALDPDAYPPYMAPRGMAFRPQRSAGMLMADTAITYFEALAYKHSTRAALADRVLDELLPAARADGGTLAGRAASALDAWDRSADADSRGAVLFQSFWREYAGAGNGFEVPWTADAPVTTPDGLSDPRAAVTALERAARSVEARYGALDVPWGEVHRLRRGDVDLPANGGPSGLGIFRVVAYEPDTGDSFRADGGDSYVALIEFGDPLRARSLIAYGNASQPGSPHRTDQLRFAAAKELRPTLRTLAEIEAALMERQPIPAPAGRTP